jgi:hypothetical protein
MDNHKEVDSKNIIPEEECVICGEMNNDLSLVVCKNGHKFHIDCFCPYAQSTKVSTQQHMPTNIRGETVNTGAMFNVELKCPICTDEILPEVLDLCEGYEGGRKRNHRRKTIRRRLNKRKTNRKKSNKRKTNKRKSTRRRLYKK